MDPEAYLEKFNSLLVLPSALIILLIFILLGVSKKREYFWKNKLIFSLIITFLLLNILEAVTYGNIYTNYDVLIRLYYSLVFVAASLILSLSHKLDPKKIIPPKPFYSTIILISFFLATLSLYTNLIIEGALINSYSLSRIPGKLYWLFQAYILLCMIISPPLIWRGILNSNNPLDKKRRKVILVSFFPLIGTVLLVIILMQAGVQINWSIFLPLSTIAFILAYLFTENRNDLFKVLVNIPFSEERKAYKLINSRILEYISKTQTNESISLKGLLSEIEKTFITNTLEMNDGNHNLAAELLSISISTIYRNKKRDEKKND